LLKGRKVGVAMWPELAGNLQAIWEVSVGNLVSWAGWPVVTHPFLLVLIAAIVLILVLRRMDKALVTFMSGLALVVLCQSTLTNVEIPDGYRDRLPVFIVGFLVLASLNVYYLLVRD
jgi:hypothetical protein